MLLGQLLLFRVPFLLALRDVDGDAGSAEVAAADVADHRHRIGGLEVK